VGVSRDGIRINIVLQVPQGDHSIVFQFQVLHIRLKILLMAAHPIMSRIGHAVKLQNGNTAIACLLNCTNEVRQCPFRSSVSGRWNQQRMVLARFESEAASFFIRILRSTAAPGKQDSVIFQRFEGGAPNSYSLSNGRTAV